MKHTNWLLVLLISCTAVKAQYPYHEKYRPQVHFSPLAHWMNDPNGMVYFNGIYHLFFQYYPGGLVWGPMHWGHTVSTDLVHWAEGPVALYPDSLGFIFSGSAVVDKNNSSGLGGNGTAPLVAIFTMHDTTRAKALTNTFQNQGLAYSLDNGKTWVKYANNPVLKNPGISDFRDPKVSWYEPGQKWVMTLATKDKVTFYSSPNLKDWTKESEIGKTFGAHGGVWECPDLFSLDYEGKKVWVLTVSINPGGPNGGSGTQYFTGQFDGHVFKPFDTATRWIDYGPDDYAGVTWGNTGDDKIFLGWMSNWAYANLVPTANWRGANTLPRVLGLQKIGGAFFVTSQPLKQLGTLITSTKTTTAFEASKYHYTSAENTPLKISIKKDGLQSFSLVLSNNGGEKTLVGYDRKTNSYYINRKHSGRVDFAKSFSGFVTAPRISRDACISMEVYIDAASVELFTDDGLSVMTAIVFPSKPYNSVTIQSKGPQLIKSLSISTLKSIWK